MCSDCHSPRDEKGQFIPSQYFEGAMLDFQPMHPVPNWVPAAPPIVGLVGWTSAEAVRFFMTGVDKNGKHAGPPMPPYRMSRQDAEAVVAYLKSLQWRRVVTEYKSSCGNWGFAVEYQLHGRARLFRRKRSSETCQSLLLVLPPNWHLSDPMARAHQEADAQRECGRAGPGAISEDEVLSAAAG
jgi:Cytochrome c